MGSDWNPELVKKTMKDRFCKGALLRLNKFHEKLAVYGWTLQASTSEAQYCPLGANDAHFVEFLGFHEYRCRKLNPLPITHIFPVGSQRRGTFLYRSREWKLAQLSSLTKIAFRCPGLAKKWTIFGYNISWAKSRQHNILGSTAKWSSYVLTTDPLLL
jgi:hypothetical protein